MKLTVWMIVGLLFVSAAQAQYRQLPIQSITNSLRTTPMGIGVGGGLLDPTKLHMSQSFSSSYGSGGGGSALSAMYMNMITYELNPKFEWQLALGYGGTAMNKYPNGTTGGVPMGGVGFQWRPTNHLTVSASFMHNSVAASPWDDPWRSFDRFPSGRPLGIVSE